MRIFLTLLLFCSLISASARAQHQITSPDGLISVTLSDHDGRLRYAISRADQPVIAPSGLGFLLKTTGRLERNLQIAAVSKTSFDESWEQPWGEQRLMRNHYQEMRAQIRETIAPHRQFIVVFRLFNDGVGFRYEWPEQGDNQIVIAEELTEFRVAEPATAWWIPSGEFNRYEYLYNETPLEEVSLAHTPMTLRTLSGLHLSFHEAALIDYAGMSLRRVEGRHFRAQLSPSSAGGSVHMALPGTTPWRTLQISPDAAGLLSSALILNLNEPNKLGDVSYFQPHKYIGIWWSMHLDEASWHSGPKHGATTENALRYIDFAAEHGFRGVLIEGWNIGWDGNWFGNGRAYLFDRPYPDFDMAHIAAYAREKGVRLIGHHETGGNICVYEAQLDRAMAYYQSHGVDAVKSGYVADAGAIIDCADDGSEVHEWHDGQRMAQHHLKVVESAHAHGIAVNPHEPIKDTGLRRTYPNWVSREGARGAEYDAWANPPNGPDHAVNLVFTRMLSGPMDYTPGVVSLVGRNGQAIQTTQAKQLAFYITLYSPIQMAADLPRNYDQFPEAFQFIKDVAVDWEETRVLNAAVGDYVTFARKDRHSADWFVGSITDGEARRLTIKLDFLDPEKTYVAQIYRDGPTAHWQGEGRFDLVVESRQLSASDRMELVLAPGGGQAIRFTPLP